MQTEFNACGELELSAAEGEVLQWKIKDTGDGWTGVARDSASGDGGML
jgi:hypothetical protein